jgi:hypothetical protein
MQQMIGRPKVRGWLVTGSAAVALAACSGGGSAPSGPVRSSQPPPSSVGVAYARTIDLTAFGGRCDGSHDDGPALRSALAAATGGAGTRIVIPSGTCVVGPQPGATVLDVPGNVLIAGTPGRSHLDYRCSPGTTYQELFHVGRDDAEITGLTIAAAGECAGVLIKIVGASGVHLQDVELDGGDLTGRDASRPLHGIELAGDPGDRIDNLSIADSTFRNLAYGLFEASPTRVSIQGLAVSRSTFSGNSADDLELNSPNGRMSDVQITGNTFLASPTADPRTGFAVGLANVQDVVIADNTFRDRFSEAIHVEDRSARVVVRDNSFTGFRPSADPNASVITVLSGSHDVSITGNVMDAGPAARSGVLVTAGGANALSPYAVTIKGNTVTTGAGSEAIRAAAVPGLDASGNRTRTAS